MGIRTENGYIGNMARQIERGIKNCPNPFVEVYLDSMDCSVAAELDNLRSLQDEAARHPHVEHSVSFSVLKKWMYGWKKADQCLECMGLRSSAEWALGHRQAVRA